MWISTHWHKGCAIGALMLSTLLNGPASATIIYVDEDAPNGGNGQSWATAFDTVYEAINATQTGDDIWVAAGTYPAAPGAQPLILGDSVWIYGGFNGTETALAQRDWIANPTIITGDTNRDDGPNFTNIQDNAKQLFVKQDTSFVILDGFVLRDANPASPDPASFLRRGGGVQLTGGSILIANCLFTDNGSHDDDSQAEGAGIYMEGDVRCTVMNTRFITNRSLEGAAIRAVDGNLLVIDGCAFIDNTSGIGGALNCAEIESLYLSNSTINGNDATAGGGAAIFDTAFVLVDDCTFINNTAYTAAGLIMNIHDSVDARILNCRFHDNHAADWGGGLLVGTHTSFQPLSVINCTFTHNTATRGAGVLGFGPTDVINCSFYGNEANGIESDDYQLVTAMNCAFENNVPHNTVLTAAQHCLSPSDTGPGWITGDPMFLEPGNGDLRLAVGSDCVNAGISSFMPSTIATDLAGNPRIQGASIDIGAYEGTVDAPDYIDYAYSISAGGLASLFPLHHAAPDDEEPSAVYAHTGSGVTLEVSLAFETDLAVFPADGAMDRLGPVVTLRSTAPAGDYLGLISVPFTGDDLPSGVDPLHLNLVQLDEQSGDWAWALSRNTQPAVNGIDQYGIRHPVTAPNPSGKTLRLGDYGTYWNPSTQKGYVWANVDRDGTFGVAFSPCPADCLQPPDQNVNVLDMYALLQHWLSVSGPYDVNLDGAINVSDFFTLLEHWGACE
jgi:hypothetical protein